MGFYTKLNKLRIFISLYIYNINNGVLNFETATTTTRIDPIYYNFIYRERFSRGDDLEIVDGYDDDDDKTIDIESLLSSRAATIYIILIYSKNNWSL